MTAGERVKYERMVVALKQPKAVARLALKQPKAIAHREREKM
jgi:hypothetical protein